MPNALRTATPMGDWRSFKFTAETPGYYGIKEGIAEGESYLYQIEDTVGAVLESAADGEEAVLIYHAEKIMVPKDTDSSDVFEVGMRVYWDPVSRLVYPAWSSSYLWIGIATEPATADDAYVEIDLKGDHAEAEAAL